VAHRTPFHTPRKKSNHRPTSETAQDCRLVKTHSTLQDCTIDP